MKRLLLSLLALFLIFNSHASCPSGFSEIVVSIVPDNWPQETSWNLINDQGVVITSGGSAGDTVCVPSGSCTQFNIYDSYGDGIYTPGGYWIYVDNVLIGTGNTFGSHAQVQANCPPGSFCTIPIPLTNYGTHTATFEDTWYSFTCNLSGTYNLTTCNNNTCNTQIWIYTTCPSTPYVDGAPGTYAFNDDNNCGTQANLNVVMVAGTTYLIRIGDNNNDCSGNINFDFSYVGPVSGCTDPTSCNYNPLAVLDDGSCIYPPSPLCNGPDLQFDSLTFINSLQMLTHTSATCDVDEGCVTGYGTRYVITFSSKINNIGTQDFYIGNPSTQPGMFNTNNCHGHAHYEGYGDYRLYAMNGQSVPAGHKNGFCVIDLCGFGQYTCGNMGISVGCYDQYGSGTQCQWLDITDVPDGDYRMAVIINSKHLPDALGRYETNFVNNALQICINITRTGGVPSFTVLPNCTPYVDCAGIPAGTAEMDCNNICNGPGVYGDSYNDGRLDSNDVSTYMDFIESNMPASICFDLNGDASISVYDAELVNWCQRGNPLHPGGSVHNHCNFPRNIVNPNDSVGLSIKAINLSSNYVDIEVKNSNAKVKAYQFTLSGVTISGVVSLADPINYPVDVRYRSSTNEVFAVSIEDSSLQRATLPQNLVRVYFSAVTDTAVCISNIREIVNQDAEKTITYVYGNCISTNITAITSVFKPAELTVLPNPATDRAFIHFSDKTKIENISLLDISGKVFKLLTQPVKEGWYEIDLHELPQGVYFIVVNTGETRGAIRICKI